MVRQKGLEAVSGFYFCHSKSIHISMIFF